MKPLIVSFHTGEDRYAKDAERMVASAEKFGYEVCLEIIDSDLDWTKANCLKPSYIQKVINKKGKRPILWLDCDGEIVKRLDPLHNPLFNLGLCWIKKDTSYFQGGTIYMDLRDPLTEKYLNEWGALCQKVINGEIKPRWDQQLLWDVWHKMDKIPITQLLEQGFVKVYDHPWWQIECSKVEYIRHHQASREIRKIK
tara:strand:+ start:1452 stop:2042 length:591 start_codon:yes stop_codon:yes gene_type:complete